MFRATWPCGWAGGRWVRRPTGRPGDIVPGSGGLRHLRNGGNGLGLFAIGAHRIVYACHGGHDLGVRNYLHPRPTWRRAQPTSAAGRVSCGVRAAAAVTRPPPPGSAFGTDRGRLRLSAGSTGCRGDLGRCRCFCRVLLGHRSGHKLCVDTLVQPTSTTCSRPGLRPLRHGLQVAGLASASRPRSCRLWRSVLILAVLAACYLCSGCLRHRQPRSQPGRRHRVPQAQGGPPADPFPLGLPALLGVGVPAEIASAETGTLATSARRAATGGWPTSPGQRGRGGRGGRPRSGARAGSGTPRPMGREGLQVP